MVNKCPVETESVWDFYWTCGTFESEPIKKFCVVIFLAAGHQDTFYASG